MVHHANLHDVVVVGDPSRNEVEGFGIWDDVSQAATLEDTQDFATFLADIQADLAQPVGRTDLELLYRLKPRPS
jgi:hypothetical protein